MKNDKFRQAYQDLNLEYEIALELIKARTKADLTQEQIAKVMGTTQSVIAKLESRHHPTLKLCFNTLKQQESICM